MTKSLPPSPRSRCSWVTAEPYYQQYHDEVWGVPVHDDQVLLEMLILEGAQAGLSWKTVLQKREGYRQAFHHFVVDKILAMTDDDLEKLVHNPAIIRHRGKIFSVRQNAGVFKKLQEDWGSFDAYVWSFVGGKPLVNQWPTLEDVPTSTPQSDALARDLKKRGMNFVGTTIMYAFMQAVGMVNDHTLGCFRSATR